METPTEKPQPADEKPEIEPRPQYSAGVQLTLLDLWGMTEEVSQPKTSKKKKTVKKAVNGKVHSAQTESHGYTDSSNCKTRNGE